MNLDRNRTPDRRVSIIGKETELHIAECQ